MGYLATGEPEAMLLEEYLPDGPPMPEGFEADYVSVETIVEAGRMTHLAITGRFPVAPPFRETGFFIPATLGTEQKTRFSTWPLRRCARLASRSDRRTRRSS